MRNNNLSIIGSGVSGLTVGCALLSQGGQTIIYEKSEKIEELGAGITLSLNATGLLDRLGILTELTKVSYLPKKIILRDYSSGHEIGGWPINVSKDNEFITVDRRDLVKVLFKHYQDLGGLVETSSEVSAIDFDNKRLEFSDGTTKSAEVILACDGIRSKIREQYFDDSKPIFSNFLAWRGVSDISFLPQFKESEEVNLYYGPKGHVVHYPIGNRGKVNFVGVKESKEWTKESWKEEGTREDLSGDFAGWNEQLLKLMTSPTKIFKWGIFERSKIQSIQKNNLALLGDAAHPMVPFLGQGCCIAIEDAYSFGLLYSKLEDLDKTFDVYEKIRLRRGNWIQRRSRLQAKFNHMTNPALVRLRKLMIRGMSKNLIRVIHSYDAHRDVVKKMKTYT